MCIRDRDGGGHPDRGPPRRRPRRRAPLGRPGPGLRRARRCRVGAGRPGGRRGDGDHRRPSRRPGLREPRWQAGLPRRARRPGLTARPRPVYARHLMAKSRISDPSALLEAARDGDRVALARLLSMVERGGDGSRSVAELAFKTIDQAYTVGVTGAPGAGKSTLTDRFITLGREQGLDGPDQLAVLAIDPSSPYSGGAILGDRVRMQSHALDDGVFIRSMATRGHLGGLAVAVPDAVRLLSAVGIPLVLIETVGVGQQEVEVAAATDTTIVVVNPGWGDAIQANKAGLLEIADLFVINKADRPGARETRRDLDLMLDLTDLGTWRPEILETVASTPSP